MNNRGFIVDKVTKENILIKHLSRKPITHGYFSVSSLALATTIQMKHYLNANFESNKHSSEQ